MQAARAAGVRRKPRRAPCQRAQRAGGREESGKIPSVGRAGRGTAAGGAGATLVCSVQRLPARQLLPEAVIGAHPATGGTHGREGRLPTQPMCPHEVPRGQCGGARHPHAAQHQDSVVGRQRLWRPCRCNCRGVGVCLASPHPAPHGVAEALQCGQDGLVTFVIQLQREALKRGSARRVQRQRSWENGAETGIAVAGHHSCNAMAKEQCGGASRSARANVQAGRGACTPAWWAQTPHACGASHAVLAPSGRVMAWIPFQNASMRFIRRCHA